MNKLDLLDRRNNYQKKAEDLVKKAENEKRSLTADEQKVFEECKAKVNELNDLLKQIGNAEPEPKTNVEDERKKNVKGDFSLLRSINCIVNNRNLCDADKAIVDLGIAEMRKAGQSYSGQIVLPVETRTLDGNIVAGQAYTANTYNGGKEVVAEDKQKILVPLRDKLVLTQAGATYLTGLVGDVSIPTYSGSSVGWKGEIASADNGAGTFGEVTLSPKRLTAYLDISKQFLIQDSANAEQMLRDDLFNAIANKLEATIFGDAQGTTTQPAGLFYNVSGDAADVTFADIVTMQTTLEGNNIDGEYKFIIAPSAKAILKTTKVDSGSGIMVMQGNEIDGYQALTTNAVKSKGVLFGNWSELVIGQWAGVDITVDPYSQATNGKVRLVVNAFFDAKLRRTNAISAKILH